ncbi:N-acetyl-alpha-D-glucosaminyl L-malate synthase BshA [Alicyclobacillus acidocaldarius]|uniref:Glycosyl transferase group 1 n=1 Tax=Alicyclobacillus acidocaldarius (strain Tc-4-1) TaxID=1048834 RepID=F8IJX0_ALIAT|nr:N-acetyl-alpha-D-glucosaminyl L-malate synthase BshA [Alicyclobacillus acidocaldarius]AEJ43482.1 glycosyl transferase group 1 [Alicyclobacillus acidocaldarius subsp. acidocaldarius Tc-4-1]
MRVGISCYPTVGGSGAVATELGKALARRGHEVHFIVTDVPFRLGAFVEHVYIHQIEPITYPVLKTPPYDFALASLMARVADEYQLDVLHAHYALPFAVCAHLAREMAKHPIRVVTTLHGTDITVLAQDPSLKSIIKLGIERSDAVTAVSQSLVRDTARLFETNKPIRCIYNFVDPDVFRPGCGGELKRHFAPNGERVLLHISNFRPVKRLHDVIAVFERVARRMPAKLLLVGEGPDLGAAKRQVEEACLSHRVHFLGRQDEVAPLFAAADLFLLPSESESFGLVALEAMSCGVPVVGSTAGGIPEVVVHGETGFLAPVGRVDEMADLACKILEDEALYRAFSARARERAMRAFHVDEKVSEYEAVYREVMSAERGEYPHPRPGA